MIPKIKIYDFSIVPSIGGNAIIIEYKNSKVLLDAGYSLSNFEMSGEEESILLVPPQNLMKKMILPNYKKIEKLLNESGESQIFISHAHSDHYSLLYYLNLESKYCQTHIYCTRFTHRTIENALEYYMRQKLFHGYSNEVESRFKDIVDRIRGTLNGRLLKNEIPIDDFEIWPIRSEHSTIQSCGFVLRIEDINLFYTGDFKRYNPDALARLKEMGLWPPRVLITEGTRLNKTEPKAYYVEEEKEVVTSMKRFLENKKKYILVTVSPKNVIRIDNLLFYFQELNIFLHSSVIRKYEVARELQQTNFAGKLNEIPEELVSAMYILPPFSSEATNKFIKRFREELKGKSMFILAEDIEHVIAGGISYENFKSKLENLDIPTYPIHASGHISMKELINFIQINCDSPPIIIPVHTLHPEILRKNFGKRVFDLTTPRRIEGDIEIMRL